MAGTLSADYIQPQSNTGLTILTPAGGTIASVNIGGIYSATGNLLISSSFNGLVANTGISGLITNDQIASVANTKITGTINSNQLGSNVAQFNGMKNRIINGAMVIDQRNAGASITNAASSTYIVDRFYINGTQASKFTAQQNAGSVTPPVGFTNYLGITSSSAYSIAAGDLFNITQVIEGYNIADLGWGTANAKTVTLSFWVRSSLTGTFGGSFLNAGAARAYPFSYTISAANTWQQISVTIAGETSGSWQSTNSSGIFVIFSLGAGSTFSNTAGAWVNGNYQSATGATSVVGTSGATFYVTGVQLEVGSQATSFEYRQYTTELALCQRYYQKSYRPEVVPGTALPNDYDGQGAQFTGTGIVTGNIFGGAVSFPVAMRTSATIKTYDCAGTIDKLSGLSNGGVITNGVNANLANGGTNLVNFRIYNVAHYGFVVAWTASAEL
tara:strand:- start:364 stop:1692 length:1329 start_codon:yes stop_codon:yes gene_type:complete